MARGVKLNRRKLRGLRQAKLLRQEDLAKMAGVTFVTISRIENGHHATYETAEKLAKALGVETEWLLERSPGDVLIEEDGGGRQRVTAGGR